MWHTIITTATEWENFFNLRADAPAEIHIQKIAYMMLLEYNKAIPKKLKEGEWHIPFGDKMDAGRSDFTDVMYERGESLDIQEGESDLAVAMTKVSIATARCARLSYLDYEGKDDYHNDLALHNGLASAGHWACR